MTKIYQSPTKRSRRLDIHVIAKADKYMAKRPYPPGQHGPGRRSKQSDYAIQLQEKQRAKFIYGLGERQFRNTYDLASKSQEERGEKLLQLLELRLDNVVYRSGIAKTRRQARQMVGHGHVQVNGKKVTIPSFAVSKSDVISPKKKDGFEFSSQEPSAWIAVDTKKVMATVSKIPARSEIPSELDEQLIVEFYSR